MLCAQSFVLSWQVGGLKGSGWLDGWVDEVDEWMGYCVSV